MHKAIILIFLVNSILYLHIEASNSVSKHKGKYAAARKESVPSSASNGSNALFKRNRIDYKKVEKIIKILLQCAEEINNILNKKNFHKEETLKKLLDVQDQLFILIDNSDQTTEYAFDLFDKLATKKLQRVNT